MTENWMLPPPPDPPSVYVPPQSPDPSLQGYIPPQAFDATQQPPVPVCDAANQQYLPPATYDTSQQFNGVALGADAPASRCDVPSPPDFAQPPIDGLYQLPEPPQPYDAYRPTETAQPFDIYQAPEPPSIADSNGWCDGPSGANDGLSGSQAMQWQTVPDDHYQPPEPPDFGAFNTEDNPGPMFAFLVDAGDGKQTANGSDAGNSDQHANAGPPADAQNQAATRTGTADAPADADAPMDKPFVPPSLLPSNPEKTIWQLFTNGDHVATITVPPGSPPPQLDGASEDLKYQYTLSTVLVPQGAQVEKDDNSRDQVLLHPIDPPNDDKPSHPASPPHPPVHHSVTPHPPAPKEPPQVTTPTMPSGVPITPAPPSTAFSASPEPAISQTWQTPPPVAAPSAPPTVPTPPWPIALVPTGPALGTGAAHPVHHQPPPDAVPPTGNWSPFPGPQPHTGALAPPLPFDEILRRGGLVPPGPAQDVAQPARSASSQQAAAQRRYDTNTAMIKAGLTPPLAGGPTPFEKRIAGNAAYTPILHRQTGQVVGYERRWRGDGIGYHAIYKRDGSTVYGEITGEDPLETPVADPTDLAMMINPAAIGGALVDMAAAKMVAKQAAETIGKSIEKKGATTAEKVLGKQAAQVGDKAIGKSVATNAERTLGGVVAAGADDAGGKKAGEALRSLAGKDAADGGEASIAKEGGALAGKEAGVVLGDLARRLGIEPEVWQKFLDAFGSQEQAEAGLKKIVWFMGGAEETRPILERFREVSHLRGSEGWLKNLATGGNKLRGTRGEMNVAKTLLDQGVKIERVSCWSEGKEAADILTSWYAIDVKTLNLSEDFLRRPAGQIQQDVDTFLKQVTRYQQLYPDKPTVYIFEGVTTEGVPPAYREALTARGVTVLGELSPLTLLR